MLQKYKRIFTNTGDVDRSSYIWNTVAGLVFAMQSAVMLMVITRTNGLNDAGIFSIAYAMGSLMSFIGEFGVRKYQASDVNEELSFTDYYSFRMLSCGAMLISSILYAGYGLVFGNYSISKFAIIVVVCLIKLIEAFVDVFYGRFQQRWRLDIGAKTNSFRMLVGMTACTIALIITHNLLVSVIVWFIVSIMAMFMSTILVAGEYCSFKVKFRTDAVKKIFMQCLPLFVGAFLLIYIGNAPKYAIDACLNEGDQARFNFIFMPVFVIGMLANFVFNPVLVKMADEWDKNNYKAFNKMVRKQTLVIGGITMLAVAVALTIGCPILGWLYATDLSPNKVELCVLMIGGGMLALVNFFAVVVTVIRYQNRLTIGYIIAALIAKVMSRYFVFHYGIMGAAVLYAVLMTILTIAFLIILVISVRDGKREKRVETE